MNSKWDKILAPQASPGQARQQVAQEARRHLATLAAGEKISTEQLVEALYPRALAVQTLAGDIAREHLYRVIGKLAMNGLEDCCEKGPPSGQYMGKVKRPWRWFAGKAEVCPTCGQFIPKKEIEESEVLYEE